MKKVIDCILFSLLLLLIDSCKQRPNILPPTAYVLYIESEGSELKKKIIIGDFVYTIQLAPPSYMACKELIDDKNYDLGKINSRVNELKGYSFFLIQMAYVKQDSTVTIPVIGENNVNQQLAYYLEQAANDLTVHTSSVNLKPATYSFENNYGLTPYNTIVAGFETGEQPEGLVIEFNDRYRNNALIKASFSKEAVTSIPSLQIKSL